MPEDGDGPRGGLSRLDPRATSPARLFSGPPGAPRTRRPTDALLLLASTLVLFAAGWAADPAGPVSDVLLELADATPAFVRSLWQIGYDLFPAWAGLVVLGALVRRQLVVALAGAAAVVIGLLVAFGIHRFAQVAPLDLAAYLRLFTVSDGPPEFPNIRMVVGTAVLVVSSPSLSRPFRFFGRILLVVGFLSAVGLGVTTVVGAVGGLAAGAVAAAAVHLALGSPGGRPRPDVVRKIMADLGVPVDQLGPAVVEPDGAVLMNSTAADGRRLAVKVYGRDAWDNQLIAKLWRWTWYRQGRSTLLLSRLHQVEHEAMVTVLAGRLGARVPDIVVAGSAPNGDAGLISTGRGTPLAEVADRGADDLDQTLVAVWSAMRTVHERGIVHGSIDQHSVAVDDDGGPLLIDWSTGSVAARAEAVHSERAQMLVLTALALGTERAVAIARASVGDAGLGDLVAYVQTPALTPDLRRAVSEGDLDIDGLRAAAAQDADVDEVELVRLRRVTIKSILSIAVVAVAAFLLTKSLANVGLDTLLDELSMAAWGWVLVALIVAQCARIFTAIGTTGATSHPLRLGPTVVLEFAITFVNLVIPSTAARIATKMRYFQKAGMTLTSATAMGAIDSIAGFSVQIVILAAAFFLGFGGISFDFNLDTSSVQHLAILVGAIGGVLLVGGVLAVLFVPRVHDKVVPILGQFKQALSVVRSPDRLLRLFGGNLVAEIVFASVLGLCLHAYGASAPLASLLVINVGVALLAGLIPSPGGIGVSEAGLTAGLVAIGVPEATAFAAAMTTRLCTFYLPPIWGYASMRWLRQNQYL